MHLLFTSNDVIKLPDSFSLVSLFFPKRTQSNKVFLSIGADFKGIIVRVNNLPAISVPINNLISLENLEVFFSSPLHIYRAF